MCQGPDLVEPVAVYPWNPDREADPRMHTQTSSFWIRRFGFTNLPLMAAETPPLAKAQVRVCDAFSYQSIVTTNLSK
jgi:hypothetical protein